VIVMFDVYCKECASQKLIFPHQVTSIDNDSDGIAVRFACWCGALGTWRTGATARRETVAWEEPALAS
jgi:hypothetical protein